MTSLDAYAPPAPLWLVVLASVLALDAGAGVSPSTVAEDVQQRMRGRFRRVSSVFDAVTRMRDDGLLRVVRVVQLGGAAHATYYAVTDAGSECFFSARSSSHSALSLPDLDVGVTTSAKRRA